MSGVELNAYELDSIKMCSPLNSMRVRHELLIELEFISFKIHEQISSARFDSLSSSHRN